MKKEKFKLLIDAMYREGGDVAKCAKELTKEFDVLSDEPLTDDELERINDRLRELKSIIRKPLVKGRRILRNDPCPCGSGIKFKKCCAPFVKKN